MHAFLVGGLRWYGEPQTTRTYGSSGLRDCVQFTTYKYGQGGERKSYPAQQATSNATPMCALRVSAFRPNGPRDGQHGRHYLVQYHLWYECYI